MTYQEYLQKAQNLIDQKDALYEVASLKLRQGDKIGADRIYSEINEVQASLDELKDPTDQLITGEEECFEI